MSSSESRFLAFVQDGTTFLICSSREQQPAMLAHAKARGWRRLNWDTTSMRGAQGARDDYDQRCSQHGHGAGQWVCSECQARALETNLEASVRLVSAALRVERKSAEQRDPLALVRGGL